MYLSDQDALVEVLKRVPAKSLVRFRCVSKSWNSLISSPNFISIHARFTDTPATEPHALLLIPSRGNFSLRFNDRSFREYRKFSFFQLEGYNAALHGFCHGLVCLSRSDDDLRRVGIIIWNPTLGKSVVLPKPRFNPHCGTDYLLGFGFDDKRNDYKVVRIRFSRHNVSRHNFLRHNSSKLDVTREYEMFELSRNAWRVISPSATLPFITARSAPVFFNGSVHWFGGLVGGTIVAFDFADELFQEMNLPGELKNADFSFLTVLVKQRKDLSVIYGDLYPKMSSTLSVWVMKEYGVEESWSKLFKIHYPDYIGIMDPIGFGTNGELIGLTNDAHMVTYDGCTRSVTFLGCRCIMDPVGFGTNGELIGLANDAHLVTCDGCTRSVTFPGYRGYCYPFNFAVDHIETLVLLQVRS